MNAKETLKNFIEKSLDGDEQILLITGKDIGEESVKVTCLCSKKDRELLAEVISKAMVKNKMIAEVVGKALEKFAISGHSLSSGFDKGEKSDKVLTILNKFVPIADAYFFMGMAESVDYTSMPILSEGTGADLIKAAKIVMMRMPQIRAVFEEALKELKDIDSETDTTTEDDLNV